MCILIVFITHPWQCEASLTVEVLPGQSRCIGQNMDKEDMALFSFGAKHLKDTTEKQIALHKEIMSLYVSIQDPDGQYLLNSEKLFMDARPREIKKNTISKNGVYNICFNLIGGDGGVPVHAYFYVDFKSRDSPGSLDSVSTQIDSKNVPEIEKKLQHAEHTLGIIHKEIEFAKEQEMSLKESGEAMFDRIQWFSLLSMAVLAVTSLWQLLYLRSYFTNKKVL